MKSPVNCANATWALYVAGHADKFNAAASLHSMLSVKTFEKAGRAVAPGNSFRSVVLRDAFAGGRLALYCAPSAPVDAVLGTGRSLNVKQQLLKPHAAQPPGFFEHTPAAHTSRVKWIQKEQDAWLANVSIGGLAGLSLLGAFGASLQTFYHLGATIGLVFGVVGYVIGASACALAGRDTSSLWTNLRRTSEDLAWSAALIGAVIVIAQPWALLQAARLSSAVTVKLPFAVLGLALGAAGGIAHYTWLRLSQAH